MTSKRKTYKIETLIEKVNGMLMGSAPDEGEARQGMATVLESVLHETGNYRGFSYLPTEWKADGSGLRDGFDDTRRRYF